MREIIKDGRGPAVWAGKGHLVLTPYSGTLKDCGWQGQELSWHKEVTTNSCTSSSPHLNSSLLGKYILFLINLDFLPINLVHRDREM